VWAGELLRELREQRADAGIVRFPDEVAGLDVRELRGDRLCALVGEGHPAAAALGPVALADLADRPLLGWAPELGLDRYNASVDDAVRAAGARVERFSARRLDVPGWLPIVDGRAFALVGEAERAPGGTVKVGLRDAPRMPVLVASRPGVAPEATALLAEAVQAALDALEARPDRAR